MSHSLEEADIPLPRRAAPRTIPAVLPARHSPEQGPTPGDDQGTKLQAQQVSHFPSLLSHFQGNVTPLGSVLDKRGNTVAGWDELVSVSWDLGQGNLP